MTNVQAVARMVESLRALGRVEPVDEPLVQAVTSLALAVDSEPGNASLWREYRAAVGDLRALNSAGTNDDEIGRIIAAIRGGAEVGDTAPAKPRDSRRRSGAADGTVRNTADAVAAVGARRRAGD